METNKWQIPFYSFQYGFTILPFLWLKNNSAIVVTKQNTVAWIEPSGPKGPPVNHSDPVIFEVINVLEMVFPDTLAPKMADCVKFQAK